VIFAGAVGDAERDRLLDEAWVFAMPTRRPADGRGGEGFGMVYAEAGAHGVPSVASRVPGVVDAVRDGETGLLVAPGDAGAVAAAAIALLGDRERRDRLGAAARERAQALAWERVLPAVEDILECARANSRARRRPRRGAARAALWPLDLALPLTVRRPLSGTGPDLDT
jgi:glycosyltransferase involved in cell wall biosynthesis